MHRYCQQLVANHLRRALPLVRLFMLCALVVFSSVGFANTQDQADLLLHLANLKERLKDAEHVPGQHGLDQVKHYQGQITNIEAQLPEQDSSSFSPDENAPWSNILDKKKNPPLAAQPKFQHPIAGLKRELQNIENKLNWITQNFDDPGADQGELTEQMNALLKNRHQIMVRLQQLKQHPYPAISAAEQQAKALQTENDKENKDAHYINQLQGQLQDIYDDIFKLRSASLQATLGGEIKEIGQKIARLELKEKNLKKRLQSMGESPDAPKILDPDYIKSKPKNDQEAFHKTIQRQIDYLDEQIQDIQEQITNAGSGNELAHLGAKMDLLQHQRMLLDQALPHEEIEQAAIENAPEFALEQGWGEHRDAPRFFTIKEPENNVDDQGHWGKSIPPSPAYVAEMNSPDRKTVVQRQAAEAPANPSYKLWDIASRTERVPDPAPLQQTNNAQFQHAKSIDQSWGDARTTHSPDFLHALSSI